MNTTPAFEHLFVSKKPVFTGIIYGTIETGETLQVRDAKTCSLFKLVTDCKDTIHKIKGCEGDKVKVYFEVSDYINNGFVVPIQIERKPEEYAPPIFETLIWTSNFCKESPLRYGDYGFANITGSLMHHFNNIGGKDDFLLDPTDFALIVSQFIKFKNCDGDPVAREEWMQESVIHALVQPENHCYYIKNIYSISSWGQWLAREQSTGRRSLVLPAADELCGQEQVPVSNQKSKNRRSPISSVLRRAVFKRDGFRCCDCGASANDEPLVKLEVDHRIPVSKGGTNDLGNLQTLCWACNNGKRDDIDHKLDSSILNDDLWAVAA